VDPKDVGVSLMDNVLTVKGEREANHDASGKDYFVREVAYGAFQRSVALPEGVDAAHVEATYANGMLEVRVPAPKAATPRPGPCRCRPTRALAVASDPRAEIACHPPWSASRRSTAASSPG
jgi:hypothetical protein